MKQLLLSVGKTVCAGTRFNVLPGLFWKVLTILPSAGLSGVFTALPAVSICCIAFL